MQASFSKTGAETICDLVQKIESQSKIISGLRRDETSIVNRLSEADKTMRELKAELEKELKSVARYAGFKLEVA